MTLTPVRAYVMALAVVGLGIAGIVVAFGLPWLTLAVVLGIVATRGWARRVVGALLVLVGVVAAVAGAAPLASSGTVSVLGVIGGVLVILGGAWTFARGATWPAMGARYDGARPAARARRPLSAWESLDQGVDPTVDPPGDAPADPSTTTPSG